MHGCVSSPDRKTKPLYEVTNNFWKFVKVKIFGDVGNKSKLYSRWEYVK